MQSKNFVFSLFVLIFVLISTSLLLLNQSTDYIFEHAKRMPDIRTVNKEYRLNYSNNYLTHKIDPDSSYVIILGDSQFYGYHQDEDDIFSTYLKKYSSSTVLNLAFDDARPEDIIKFLELIRLHNVKIDAIIYGLNLRHFGSLEGTSVQRLPANTKPTLLPLYLIKPNIDFWSQKLKKELFNTHFSQIFTAKVDSSIAVAPQKIDPRYVKLLQKFRELSSPVLIISEPRSEFDILRQSKNEEVKNKWMQLYKEETGHFGFNFLDASEWMDNSCFIDNTHFNAKGHKVFFQGLLNKLYQIWPNQFSKK